MGFLSYLELTYNKERKMNYLQSSDTFLYMSMNDYWLLSLRIEKKKKRFLSIEHPEFESNALIIIKSFLIE